MKKFRRNREEGKTARLGSKNNLFQVIKEFNCEANTPITALSELLDVPRSGHYKF